VVGELQLDTQLLLTKIWPFGQDVQLVVEPAQLKQIGEHAVHTLVE
jgi:hypothetical protein